MQHTPRNSQLTMRVVLWLHFLLLCFVVSGCSPLSAKKITSKQIYRSEGLLSKGPQIERGKPNKVVDTVGWVVGIPTKLLLWDRRADNHKIGNETQGAIHQYLDQNDLKTVKVRLNQYSPMQDAKRLVKNKSVGAPWRYTVGALSVLGEAVIPGRVFGGDHYNPYTNTIHLYSDIPAVALHEAGHAKDFARRKWKGTYAAAYGLPIVPLYHESVASRDVVAYLESYGSPQEQAEAYRILYPAYGTYVGSAAGTVLPSLATPFYYGAVLAGHGFGRYKASQVQQAGFNASNSQPIFGPAIDDTSITNISSSVPRTAPDTSRSMPQPMPIPIETERLVPASDSVPEFDYYRPKQIDASQV